MKMALFLHQFSRAALGCGILERNPRGVFSLRIVMENSKDVVIASITDLLKRQEEVEEEQRLHLFIFLSLSLFTCLSSYPPLRFCPS